MAIAKLRVVMSVLSKVKAGVPLVWDQIFSSEELKLIKDNVAPRVFIDDRVALASDGGVSVKELVFRNGALFGLARGMRDEEGATLLHISVLQDDQFVGIRKGYETYSLESERRFIAEYGGLPRFLIAQPLPRAKYWHTIPFSIPLCALNMREPGDYALRFSLIDHNSGKELSHYDERIFIPQLPFGKAFESPQDLKLWSVDPLSGSATWFSKITQNDFIVQLETRNLQGIPLEVTVTRGNESSVSIFKGLSTQVRVITPVHPIQNYSLKGTFGESSDDSSYATVIVRNLAGAPICGMCAPI